MFLGGIMEAKALDRYIEEAITKTPMEILTNGAIVGLHERERAIAEISFKAGIRKVVGYLQPHMTCNKAGLMQTNIDYIEWQAKLKEWGINP